MPDLRDIQGRRLLHTDGARIISGTQCAEHCCGTNDCPICINGIVPQTVELTLEDIEWSGGTHPTFTDINGDPFELYCGATGPAINCPPQPASGTQLLYPNSAHNPNGTFTLNYGEIGLMPPILDVVRGYFNPAARCWGGNNSFGRCLWGSHEVTYNALISTTRYVYWKWRQVLAVVVPPFQSPSLIGLNVAAGWAKSIHDFSGTNTHYCHLQYGIQYGQWHICPGFPRPTLRPGCRDIELPPDNNDPDNPKLDCLNFNVLADNGFITPCAADDFSIDAPRDQCIPLTQARITFQAGWNGTATVTSEPP